MRTYVIVFAVLAGGCNSAAPSALAPGALDRLVTSAARLPAQPHRDRGPSWFAPDAGAPHAEVLFVSDSGTSDVYVYKVPSLKLSAKITGFTQPQGECADDKGNVWVTDTYTGTIYELSHYGHLKSTMSEKDVYPVGCAWDANTGNLAVMNLLSAGGAPGNVAIFSRGSSTPTIYTDPDFAYYVFAGYDKQGDLFFDGRDENGKFVLGELTRKAKSPRTIGVSGQTIYFPGMVQWTGSRLNIGDQSCDNGDTSCVYALTVSGDSATIVGETKLNDYASNPVCDLVQGVISKQQLFGSDYDFCGSAASTTYGWAYPAGGAPTVRGNRSDLAPVGAALSN